MSADKDALLREDEIELAYWRFDARRKGYSDWKGAPQSERDAFKSELRARITAALAEKDDGWIKCSERLPTDREEYLVAFQMGDHVYCRPELLNPAMTGFYVTCNEGDGSPAETAIAWRPLPPLPKGDKQ